MSSRSRSQNEPEGCVRPQPQARTRMLHDTGAPPHALLFQGASALDELGMSGAERTLLSTVAQEGFELRGESTPLGALVRDLWRSRGLVRILARKDFFVRYRRA